MKRRCGRLELFVGVAATALVWFPAGCGHTSRDGEPDAGAASNGGSSGAANAPATGGEGTQAPGALPCADDAACLPSGRRCDPQRFVCTDCVSVRDCGPNQVCSGGACLPFSPCEVTRQCEAGSVCDTSAGFCVECVGDADCDVNEKCANTTCHAKCASNADCNEQEPSCDPSSKHCVECQANADCGQSAYCSAGYCEDQVCEAGRSLCVGSALLTCRPQGSGYALEACKVGCAEPKAGARCLPEGEGGGGTGAGAGGSSTVEGGQSGTDGGVAGAGAANAGAGSAGTDTCPPTPDEITVPDCGYVGAQSRDGYRGLVTLRVSGVIYGAPGVPNDPFYVLDSQDLTKGQSNCPTCLVFNRASEGECVCQFECPGKAHALSALLVGAYPEFRSDHDYTVQIDLGPKEAERLNFALGDCGCDDNSGSFALSFECTE